MIHCTGKRRSSKWNTSYRTGLYGQSHAGSDPIFIGNDSDPCRKTYPQIYDAIIFKFHGRPSGDHLSYIQRHRTYLICLYFGKACYRRTIFFLVYLTVSFRRSYHHIIYQHSRNTHFLWRYLAYIYNLLNLYDHSAPTVCSSHGRFQLILKEALVDQRNIAMLITDRSSNYAGIGGYGTVKQIILSFKLNMLYKRRTYHIVPLCLSAADAFILFAGYIIVCFYLSLSLFIDGAACHLRIYISA